MAGATRHVLSPIFDADSMNRISSYLSSGSRGALHLARSEQAESTLTTTFLPEITKSILAFACSRDLVNLAFAVQPRLNYLLREKQGFDTDAEIIQDFIDFNGPEIDTALSAVAWPEPKQIVSAIGAVVVKYLDCLDRPFCKYLPAYLRDPARFAEIFTPGPTYTVTFGPSEDVAHEFVTIEGNPEALKFIHGNYIFTSELGPFLKIKSFQ